jgi:hypothetical protein
MEASAQKPILQAGTNKAKFMEPLSWLADRGRRETTHTPRFGTSGSATHRLKIDTLPNSERQELRHTQPDNDTVSNVGQLCVANVTRVSVIKVSKLAVVIEVIDVECRTCRKYSQGLRVLVVRYLCQVNLFNLFKLNFVSLVQFRDSEFSSVVVPCSMIYLIYERFKKYFY